MGQLHPHCSTGGLPSLSGQGAPAPLPTVPGATLSRTSYWCTSTGSRGVWSELLGQLKGVLRCSSPVFRACCSGKSKEHYICCERYYHVLRDPAGCVHNFCLINSRHISTVEQGSCALTALRGTFAASSSASAKPHDNILSPDVLQGLDITRSFVRADNERSKQPGVVYKRWWLSYIELSWMVSQAAWAALQYPQ